MMELRYRHIMEDFESGTTSIAIRLEPRFYVGKKAAGCTFLGAESLKLLKEGVVDGLVQERPDARLIPRNYYGVWAAIHRAGRRTGLDPKIQTCHGFRKYFENALDDANIDHEKKMVIEGHFAGTRAKHYTDRDVEELRDVYRRAYPFVRLGLDEPIHPMTNNENYSMRFAALEARLDRQRVLEAKLTILEDEMGRMKWLRKLQAGE